MNQKTFWHWKSRSYVPSLIIFAFPVPTCVPTNRVLPWLFILGINFVQMSSMDILHHKGHRDSNFPKWVSLKNLTQIKTFSLSLCTHEKIALMWHFLKAKPCSHAEADFQILDCGKLKGTSLINAKCIQLKEFRLMLLPYFNAAALSAVS